MRQIKLRLMILGVLCTSSILFAQTNNRVSIQTGLLHCFFDGSPVLNVNYLDSESTKRHPFKGLFLSSIGAKFDRRIAKNSLISVEFMSFRTSYSKHVQTFPDGDFFNPPKPVVYIRNFATINLSYSQLEYLTDKFHFVYGGGISFRHGEELIIVNKGWFDLLIENIRRNDIGLNTFVGIDYTPVKWLTLSTKIDFLGFVYIHDKEKAKRLKEVYDSPQFPSKYDLSLRFSLGFNFGNYSRKIIKK